MNGRRHGDNACGPGAEICPFKWYARRRPALAGETVIQPIDYPFMQSPD